MASRRHEAPKQAEGDNLAATFQSLKLSTHLSFASKQLKLDTRADGELIAEEIRNCDVLDTLELRGNTLGVEATIPIADALESRPELRKALWSDLFTGRLKEEIPKTLKLLCDAMSFCSARLVELDLSDNAIGPMALPGIMDFLASEHACELKVLKLNNCGLGIAGKTIAECLMECHRKSLEIGTPLRLQTFIAGRNRLEYISTCALAKAFKQIGSLEEISMPQNGIKAEGIVHLADAVQASPLLRVLNLGDNTFGQKGALSMAKALNGLTFLEVVDFGDCLCRNKGSIEIVSQLAKSKSLKQLNLSGSEIDFTAAKEIVQKAKSIPRLEILNLGLNCFGSQFESLKSDFGALPYLDLGSESDDQGSLSGDESEGEDNDTAGSTESEGSDD